MRSPNYGQKSKRGSNYLPIYLVGRRVEEGVHVLEFDGPGIEPFEMVGGDWQRAIFRTELLKVGAFKLPHHLRRPPPTKD